MISYIESEVVGVSNTLDQYNSMLNLPYSTIQVLCAPSVIGWYDSVRLSHMRAFNSAMRLSLAARLLGGKGRGRRQLGTTDLGVT